MTRREACLEAEEIDGLPVTFSELLHWWSEQLRDCRQSSAYDWLDLSVVDDVSLKHN